MRTRQPKPQVEHVEPRRRETTSPSAHVHATNDPAEGRAERLADRAMSTSASLLAGQPSVFRSPSGSGGGSRPGSFDIPASRIDRAAALGRPLDAPVRQQMEAGFGRDLSGVRMHTGARAARLSADLGAAAFTSGKNIFFGADRYDPGTPEGDHLIAHEVAHTIDAGGGGVHRFPDTALTSGPVPWKEQTASVIRPGSGASGGVYILKSKEDDGTLKTVVVKPSFGQNAAGDQESLEQMTSAEHVLRKLGLTAPKSRPVTKGQPEFNELVEVCKPHQPPRPDQSDPLHRDDFWVPMEQADGFLIMGEVSNAKSINELALDATRGGKKLTTLWDLLFNERFLRDLGKLSVGDMLLNNRDRIVLGGSNLGNILLSMNALGGTIQAIDTAAQLSKTSDVESVKIKGGVSASRYGTLAEMKKNGPEGVLDGFFATISKVMLDQEKAFGSSGHGVAKGATPGSQFIAQMYKYQRSAALKRFTVGWNVALARIEHALNDKEGVFKEATSGGDQNVTEETLRGNAHYLVQGFKKGATHEEATSRNLGNALVNRATTNSMSEMGRFPNDQYLPTVLQVPDKKALKSDSEGREIANPPALAAIGDYGNGVIYRKHEENFNQMKSFLDSAYENTKATINTTKTKGLFNKKAVPTNRWQHAKFLIDSEGMIVGMFRLGTAVNKFTDNAKQLRLAGGAEFGPGGAAVVAKQLEEAQMVAIGLNSAATGYVGALGKSAAALPHSSEELADDLLEHVRAALTTAQEVERRIKEVKSETNFNTLAAAVRKKKPLV